VFNSIGDRAAEGRAAGNLGNTFYLLGNFTEAIHYHQQVKNTPELRIGADGGRWQRMGVDGGGWGWIAADGGG